MPRDRFETVGSKLNLLKCSSNATAQAIAYSKLDMSHAKKKIVNETEKPKDKIYIGYEKSTNVMGYSLPLLGIMTKPYTYLMF